MNPGWRGFAAYAGLPILNRSAVNTTDRRFIEKRNFKAHKARGKRKSGRFHKSPSLTRRVTMCTTTVRILILLIFAL